MALIGLLSGFLAGWLLSPESLSALLAPTTVTWSAAMCEAGVYTITSTAEMAGRGGAGRFTVTTRDVQLPQSQIVQQFADLPAGDFRVSATVRRQSDGKVFHSDVQSIRGQASGLALGRTRPGPQPRLGRARPRGAERSAPASSAVADIRPTTTAPASPVRQVPADSASHHGKLIVIELEAVLNEASQVPQLWRLVELVDEDGDGEIDVVRLELANGERRDWRLRR